MHKIVSSNVNISTKPRASPRINATEVTFGDLHANPLLMLYSLIREGIIEMPAQDYAAFEKMYKHANHPFIFSESGPKPNPKYNKQDYQKTLKQFKSLLPRITVKDKNKLVRFIGDELVDRSHNDYFILKLIQLLDTQGANFEIMLSNHGLEFIQAYENLSDLQQELVFPTLSKQHSSSGRALRQLIKDGVIDLKEVQSIANHHYKKHVKLISYSIDRKENKINIYTHAGIDLAHIKILCNKFAINYDDSSITAFAQVLDKIDEHFQTYVDKNEVHTLFNEQILKDGYNNNLGRLNEKTVITSFVWNRKYKGFESTTPNFKIHFIHGHDDNDPRTAATQTTLNSPLGRFDKVYGVYKAFNTNCKLARTPISLPEPAKDPSTNLKKINIPAQPWAPSVVEAQKNLKHIKLERYPVSYTTIWSNTYGDEADKITALLQDYVKSEGVKGKLLRFFTLHWNRHHVSSIEEILKKTQLNSAELINALDAIHISNAQGSLARRIRFIKMQTIENPDPLLIFNK